MELFISYPYLLLMLAIVILLKIYCNGPKVTKKKSLTGKIVIVTGSNQGLGKVTALDLLQQGATVILACRDAKKTLDTINDINDEDQRSRAIFMKVDLAKFSSVISFAKEFTRTFETLDILVNNAGMLPDNDYIRSEDGIEMTLQVNVLSPMLLTQELLPLLAKSKGRVINLASIAHIAFRKDSSYYDAIDVTDEQKLKEMHSSYTTYPYTKIGNIFFTQYLKKHCEMNGLDVKCAALHPGVIFTELYRYRGKCFFYLVYPIIWIFFKSTYRGAQTTLHLCYLNDNEIVSGGYYSDCKLKKLMKHASNEDTMEAAIRLFKRFIDTHGKNLGISFTL